MRHSVHQPAWRLTPERGSLGVIRFMAWFTLTMGRRVSRWLLPPIVLYFMISAPSARRASRVFLGRALGRAVRWRDVYRHIHTFSAVVVDRIHFFAGRFEQFDIRMHGVAELDAALAGGGCVILGAHVGSFEALRAAARRESPHEVVMLMDEANARKIGRVLAELNPDAAQDIINVGDPGSVIKAKERLDAGALIGVLGDRCRPGDRPVACNFLGQPAEFPHGPLALALALRAPVYLGFGLYRSGNRYDIHFERLSDPRDHARHERAALLEHLAREYSLRLEHYARIAPFNWFNFYDFWEAQEHRDGSES